MQEADESEVERGKAFELGAEGKPAVFLPRAILSLSGALQRRGPRDPPLRAVFSFCKELVELLHYTCCMKKYRSAVSALVIRGKEAEILLVHKPRTHDAWQMPQGGVEEGESIEQAALRELQEEAGLALSSVRFTSTERYCYDFPPEYIRRYHPINDGQCLRFVVIEVPTDAQVRVDQEEVDSFVWVSPEELGKYLKRAEYLKIVRSVLREYGQIKN